MQTLCARKQKSKHTSMPVWTENSTEVSRTWGWIWYQKIYPFYIHVSFKLIKLLFSTPLFVVRLNNWRGFFFFFYLVNSLGYWSTFWKSLCYCANKTSVNVLKTMKNYGLFVPAPKTLPGLKPGSGGGSKMSTSHNTMATKCLYSYKCEPLYKKNKKTKNPSSTCGKEGFNRHGIWNLSQTFAHLVWSLLLKCLWNLKCKNVWKLGFFFNTNHWNLVLFLFFLFFGKLESPAQKNLFLDDILQARDHTRESKKKNSTSTTSNCWNCLKIRWSACHPTGCWWSVVLLFFYYYLFSEVNCMYFYCLTLLN